MGKITINGFLPKIKNQWISFFYHLRNLKQISYLVLCIIGAIFLFQVFELSYAQNGQVRMMFL